MGRKEGLTLEESLAPAKRTRRLDREGTVGEERGMCQDCGDTTFIYGIQSTERLFLSFSSYAVSVERENVSKATHR
jgi:hypothetical protein